MNHTLGLQKLIGAYEALYSLPHQEAITEEFIGQAENDSAIFAKYLLPSNKIAICATSIEHPIFSMMVRGQKTDKAYRYSTNPATGLELFIAGNRVVGIKTSGHWPNLNGLCELLLSEKVLADVSENALLKLVYTP